MCWSYDEIFMKSNPGGYIPANEVVGRDELIRQLWRILDRQSLMLTAERRLGKTSILNKMKDECPPGRIVLYQDLEAVSEPIRFVEAVFRAARAHLSVDYKGRHVTRTLFEALGKGGEVAALGRFPEVAAKHWKDILEAIFADLSESTRHTVIFFWDEFPWMIQKIAKESTSDAVEVLDTLRALRQTYPGVRMALTGSIGIHHAIAGLREAGYGNSPVNDLLVVTVPALDTDAAQTLALRLFEAEGYSMDECESSASAVAAGVDGLPYFIHHVIDRMKARGRRGSLEAVSLTIAECLMDPQDPWDLRNYVTRLSHYYSGAECAIALGALDSIAASDEPVGLDHIVAALRSRRVKSGRDQVQAVVAQLQSDHYIALHTDGRFTFTYPIIRRSWRLQRGL